MFLAVPGYTGISRPAGRTQGARQPAAVFSLSHNGGDTHQLTLRLHQQIGQTNGVIDIGADIGIQQNFFHLYYILSGFACTSRGRQDGYVRSIIPSSR